MNFFNILLVLLFKIYAINGQNFVGCKAPTNQNGVNTLDYDKLLIDELTNIHECSNKMMDFLFIFSMKNQRRKSDKKSYYYKTSRNHTLHKNYNAGKFRQDGDIKENTEKETPLERCEDCQLIVNATDRGIKMMASDANFYKLFCKKSGINVHMCELYVDKILMNILATFKVLTDHEVLCKYTSSACRVDSQQYNSILLDQKIPCDLCRLIMNKGIQIGNGWVEAIHVFQEACTVNKIICSHQIKSLISAIQGLVGHLELWMGVLDGCKTLFGCVEITNNFND